MAIIRTSSRPALPISQGTFEAASGEWECLNGYRETIENTIRGIGRIEIEGHPYMKWVGTGVFVAPGRFMTASHVARTFSNGIGDSNVTMNPDLKVFIVANDALGSAVEFKMRVSSVCFIHPLFDVALCEVEARGFTDDPQPDTSPQLFSDLTVAASLPKEVIGRKVAVVGFNTQDSRNEQTLLRSIYGDIRESLYLQPGEITDVRENQGKLELFHDCTTLGGSAGAPLLDLETGLVLGIHFGGRYLASNSAVPSWELGRDFRVRWHGVNFSDQPTWMGKWIEAEIVSRTSRQVAARNVRPVFEHDADVRYFAQSDLYKIRDLLVRAGFASDDRQSLLFISMNPRLVAALPTQGSPDSRLMSVLDKLNRTAPLADDEVPLRTLLFNATENAKPLQESKILERFQNMLPVPPGLSGPSIKE